LSSSTGNLIKTFSKPGYNAVASSFLSSLGNISFGVGPLLILL